MFYNLPLYKDDSGKVTLPIYRNRKENCQEPQSEKGKTIQKQMNIDLHQRLWELSADSFTGESVLRFEGGYFEGIDNVRRNFNGDERPRLGLDLVLKVIGLCLRKRAFGSITLIWQEGEIKNISVKLTFQGNNSEAGLRNLFRLTGESFFMQENNGKETFCFASHPQSAEKIAEGESSAIEVASDGLLKILDLISSKKFALLVTTHKSPDGSFRFRVEPDENNQPPKEQDYLDSREAADLIHHSSYWISRKENREKHGISVYRMGGRTMFKKDELLRCLTAGKEKKSGRPRKEVFIETS